MWHHDERRADLGRLVWLRRGSCGWRWKAPVSPGNPCLTSGRADGPTAVPACDRMGARCGAALAVARLSHALGCFQGRECPVTTEAAYHHIRAEQYWPEDVPGRLSCLGAEESMHI